MKYNILHLKNIDRFLFTPVNPSSLILFRFFFGAFSGWYAFYELSTNAVFPQYIATNFYFTFSLFDVLHLPFLPPQALYTLFKIMGVSACCIALGIFYRIALITFFLSFGYIFLLDKTYFNNHYYLILLITFLLFFMNAHHGASIDALRNPKLSNKPIQFWNIMLLRAQFCIVYFFAGITKIGKDYLDGRQMHIWLNEEGLIPFLQPYASSEWVQGLFIIGSILTDIALPFLLCYKPTRTCAIVLAIIFHLTNQWLFHIGIFHYLMIAALVLFVEPDEPYRLWVQIKNLLLRKPYDVSRPNLTEDYTEASGINKTLIKIFIGIYLMVQLLLPFRPLIYPGNVNWTREGHRFSWRLKANITTGGLSLAVIDPATGEIVPATPFDDINPEQYLVMSYTPDMILQYVHFLKKKLESQGIKNPIIKIDGRISLNGRPFHPQINKDVNLAEKKYKLFQTADWLMPPPPDL